LPSSERPRKAVDQNRHPSADDIANRLRAARIKDAERIGAVSAVLTANVNVAAVLLSGACPLKMPRHSKISKNVMVH
jgi:hypothetical protein